MWRLNRLVILLSVGFFCLGFLAQAEVIELKVNKEKVETGEVFTYLVEIKGYFLNPKLKLPEFNNFQIAGQLRSQNFSFDQGKQKTEITLTYSLFAAEPGVYTIEPVVLLDQKTEYKSQSIIVTVKGKALAEKRKILPYIRGGTEL